jgi:gamma-glutamylcysteine synthetase
MEINEIVMKLVGPVQAVGQHEVDERRLTNLKNLIGVVETLVMEISDASEDAGRPEASMKAIAQEAEKYLQNLRKWLNEE